MYQSERTFIMKFLASLYQNNVKKIPYDTPQFYDGIISMEIRFNQIAPNLGKYKDEIGMLFVRNPIGGIFEEFKSGISNQNGLLMTFENPNYIYAAINMDDKDSEYILNHGDIGITKEIMSSFAISFCEGAKLDYKVRD